MKTNPTRKKKNTIGKSPNLTIQAKLTIGQPNDQYEQEADAMADQVMRMPDTEAPVQRKCEDCEAESLQMKPLAGSISPIVQKQSIEEEEGALQMKSEGGGITGTNALSSQLQQSKGGGSGLPAKTNQQMSAAFGTDFSGVRVHTDTNAVQMNRSLNARAFTHGNDVYFNKREFNPNGGEGKRLLAHELTHVVQQGGREMIQRQEIPQELMSSIDVGLATEQVLIDRHDLIVTTLLQFDQSTPETALLEEELGRIGVELGRRSALAAGTTFTEQSIERMKTFFITNATSPSPQSCIATLNQGVRNVLNDQTQRMGSEIQTSMSALQTSGRISGQQVIEFLDSRGRTTTGVRRPVTLSANVWDTLIAIMSNEVGWSVFGLSLMDGYHSIILTFDNNDPNNQHVYWSDQWSSKGGWREYTRASLDAEITRLTQQWWDGQASGAKHRTRVTLWRLIQ